MAPPCDFAGFSDTRRRAANGGGTPIGNQSIVGQRRLG
jgi:hypothetical protein